MKTFASCMLVTLHKDIKQQYRIMSLLVSSLVTGPTTSQLSRRLENIVVKEEMSVGNLESCHLVKISELPNKNIKFCFLHVSDVAQ